MASEHRCPGCFSRSMLDLCVREAKRTGRAELAREVLAELNATPPRTLVGHESRDRVAVWLTLVAKKARAVCVRATLEKARKR